MTYIQILWRPPLNWGSLLSEDCSLCQGDRRSASTVNRATRDSPPPVYSVTALQCGGPPDPEVLYCQVTSPSLHVCSVEHFKCGWEKLQRCPGRWLWRACIQVCLPASSTPEHTVEENWSPELSSDLRTHKPKPHTHQILKNHVWFLLLPPFRNNHEGKYQSNRSIPDPLLPSPPLSHTHTHTCRGLTPEPVGTHKPLLSLSHISSLQHPHF